jgi:hypothetical protein
MAVKVERRDIFAEHKDTTAAKVTFREAVIQYHAENKESWKSQTYTRQWLAALENYAFPELGNEITGAITAADIITTLSPIWQDIPETARQYANVFAPFLIMPTPRVGAPAKRLPAMAV